MKEELITFEIAKLAKEKGFDWPVYSFYYANGTLVRFSSYDVEGYKNWEGWYYWEPTVNLRTSAPTQSLLQRWLREEKEIDIYVYRTWRYDNSYNYSLSQISTGLTMQQDSTPIRTYESALEAGLQKALELIK